MSAAQIEAKFAVSPMVLDLDGNGVSTLSAREGVNFDLNATGSTANQYGWVGGNDGLLVRDINQDGTINDGRELFGSATVLSNGQRAGDGYTAMLDLDANQDHKLTAADAAFKELQVWVDADHDGQTDTGELKTLADLGIVELDLNAQRSTATDNGNLLGLVSSYTTNDGNSHAMADVWFHRDVDGAQAVTTADVLADHGSSAALEALSASASNHDKGASADAGTNTASAADVHAAAINASAPAISPDASVAVDITKGLLDDKNNNLLI